MSGFLETAFGQRHRRVVLGAGAVLLVAGRLGMAIA